MGVPAELSPHPVWIHTLQHFMRPYWDTVLNGSFVQGAAKAELSVPELRGWMLQMYPFIHAFPKFLAEALIKVEDDYSRSFLIDNIRVEKAHAEHWIWMGQGFGLKREDMLEMADYNQPVLRDVQSLTDWLWYINTKGSLPEAIAATSFAIEGVTGDLARKTLEGFESYRDQPGVDMSNRTSKWMREHARYDDEHPKIALEIIKQYATTERLQKRVILAARRSLQLLDLAFNTAYRAYSSPDSLPEEVRIELRTGDRRKHNQVIPFPDRRVGERRGRGIA